jgi:hypothetical protein
MRAASVLWRGERCGGPLTARRGSVKSRLHGVEAQALVPAAHALLVDLSPTITHAASSATPSWLPRRAARPHRRALAQCVCGQRRDALPVGQHRLNAEALQKHLRAAAAAAAASAVHAARVARRLLQAPRASRCTSPCAPLALPRVRAVSAGTKPGTRTARATAAALAASLTRTRKAAAGAAHGAHRSVHDRVHVQQRAAAAAEQRAVRRRHRRQRRTLVFTPRARCFEKLC